MPWKEALLTSSPRPRILLVLGGTLEPIDQLSSQDTLLRCGQALRTWHRGEHDHILVTGGICWGPDLQTRPLSTLMKEWLVQRGVPAERIIEESGSLDTFQNIEFSLRVLREQGLNHARITLVSQWQHVVRACITLLAYFVLPARPVIANYRLPRRDFWREFLFIGYHLLDWRGRLPPARKNREQRRAAASSQLSTQGTTDVSS